MLVSEYKAKVYNYLITLTVFQSCQGYIILTEFFNNFISRNFILFTG